MESPSCCKTGIIVFLSSPRLTRHAPYTHRTLHSHAPHACMRCPPCELPAILRRRHRSPPRPNTLGACDILPASTTEPNLTQTTTQHNTLVSTLALTSTLTYQDTDRGTFPHYNGTHIRIEIAFIEAHVLYTRSNKRCQKYSPYLHVCVISHHAFLPCHASLPVACTST